LVRTPGPDPLDYIFANRSILQLHYISFLALFRLFRLYQILTLLNGKGEEFVILTGITANRIIFGGFAVVIAESNNQESNIKNVSDDIQGYRNIQ
jgi:hypothetical protein